MAKTKPFIQRASTQAAYIFFLVVSMDCRSFFIFSSTRAEFWIRDKFWFVSSDTRSRNCWGSEKYSSRSSCREGTKQGRKDRCTGSTANKILKIQRDIDPVDVFSEAKLTSYSELSLSSLESEILKCHRKSLGSGESFISACCVSQHSALMIPYSVLLWAEDSLVCPMQGWSVLGLDSMFSKPVHMLSFESHF